MAPRTSAALCGGRWRCCVPTGLLRARIESDVYPALAPPYSAIHSRYSRSIAGVEPGTARVRVRSRSTQERQGPGQEVSRFVVAGQRALRVVVTSGAASVVHVNGQKLAQIYRQFVSATLDSHQHKF